MKRALGIVRKIDSIGRIVIPKELLDCMFNENEKRLVQIQVSREGSSVVLTKFNSSEDQDSIVLVRKIDDLGRLVIPKEIRDNIFYGDEVRLSFFIKDDSIILEQYTYCCIFCANAEEGSIKRYKGVAVCGECVDGLKRSV